MKFIDSHIRLELISPNVTAHWRAKLKQNQRIKSVIHFELAFNQKLGPVQEALENGYQIKIGLHRCGRREMDYDNLVFAFKPIRDTVAGMIIPGLAAGRADGDDRLIWEYSQSTGADYFVNIVMEKGDFIF